MPRKRYSTEPIVTKLRQAEVELGRGLRTPPGLQEARSVILCSALSSTPLEGSLSPGSSQKLVYGTPAVQRNYQQLTGIPERTTTASRTAK